MKDVQGNQILSLENPGLFLGYNAFCVNQLKVRSLLALKGAGKEICLAIIDFVVY